MSFIPGMTGIVSGVGGEPPLAPLEGVALFSETGSSGASIAWPADTLPGDFALLFESGYDSSDTGGAGGPSIGFTNLATEYASGANSNWRISYKLLTATEVGSITGGINENAELKALRVFRGTNRPIDDFIVSYLNYDQGGSGARPYIVDATDSVALRPRVVFGYQHQVTGGSSIDFTAVPAFASSVHASTGIDGPLEGKARVGITMYGTRGDAGFLHSVNAGSFMLAAGMIEFR